MLYELIRKNGYSSDVAEELGEVGEGLYWLAVNDFPIATTWVLGTSAFDLILSRVGADRDVAEMRWSLAGLWNDMAAVKRVMASLEDQRVDVSRALRGAEMPDVLGQALELVALMDTLWMVRASLSFDDRVAAIPEFSLSAVRGGAGLWDGIRQVWASAFRQEVLSHCALSDIPLPNVAVVLHPIGAVTAQDRSGVVFSEAPWPSVSGPAIRVVYGARQDGKGHVYGTACGQWVQLKRESSPPEWVMVTGENGGMGLWQYPGGEPLVNDDAQQLAQLAAEVAAKWEGPVALDFFWPAGSEPVLLRVQVIE